VSRAGKIIFIISLWAAKEPLPSPPPLLLQRAQPERGEIDALNRLQ
jgi:hypothetical protein